MATITQTFTSPPAIEEDDDEDIPDETLVERLVGLTEMFPDGVRSSCSGVSRFTWNSMKFTFSFTRSAVWVLASSLSILMLPIVFEREGASMKEAQLQQQRQMLLGPNAAVSGQPSGQGMMGMMPPGMAPPPPPTAPKS